jgi:hypothetical protein
MADEGGDAPAEADGTLVAAAPAASAAVHDPSRPPGPRQRRCHICGEMQMLKSFGSQKEGTGHVATCLRLWKEDEKMATKPRNPPEEPVPTTFEARAVESSRVIAPPGPSRVVRSRHAAPPIRHGGDSV